MVRLKELSSNLNLTVVSEANPVLTGISEDSRLIRPGMLFAAVKGVYADGRAYIEDAIKKGAAAILLSEGSEIPQGAGVVFAPAEELRPLMSQAAAIIYDHPADKMMMLGITGTNGKTSSSYLLESIFGKAGRHSGVIGTINFRWPGHCQEAPNTTPEGALLHSSLAEMLAAGASTAILEVSSHGLSIGRVKGIKFDAALFTNLSLDHLDFHKDMENYYQAKKLLFTEHLKDNGISVINTDDEFGKRLAYELKGKVITFGFNNEAQVRGYNLTTGRQGISFMLESPWGSWLQKSPLLADCNAYNILGVAAMSLALGHDPDVIKLALSNANGAPGRLERVGLNDDYLVLVDYSHTPDALEKSLKACRALDAKRVICVMGCGGDRDHSKRPIMGALSAELADLTIVTSDNPRTEEPMAIIEEIEDGLKKKNVKPIAPGQYSADSWKSSSYMVIEDRATAIKEAIAMMDAGDVLLIAGKGHENYQIIGREKRHFDDCEEASKALKGRGL